jgi:hypothetical protein
VLYLVHGTPLARMRFLHRCGPELLIGNRRTSSRSMVPQIRRKPGGIPRALETLVTPLGARAIGLSHSPTDTEGVGSNPPSPRQGHPDGSDPSVDLDPRPIIQPRRLSIPTRMRQQSRPRATACRPGFFFGVRTLPDSFWDHFPPLLATCCEKPGSKDFSKRSH